MDRRKFIGAVTVAGGASAGLAHAADKTVKEDASVEWIVKGFSCVTCAIGLETLLRQQKAITRVKAEYRGGRVQIGFDSSKIAPSAIKRLIEEAGFKVAG